MSVSFTALFQRRASRSSSWRRRARRRTSHRSPRATATPPVRAPRRSPSRSTAARRRIPDGSIASYAWTFGDGGNATGPTANHTYATAGSYSAKLTVTDNQDATGTTTNAITVNPGLTTPAAPSNLSGSAGSNRLVTLNWTDNSSNETGFYVERAAKTKNLQFSRVATVGVNVKAYSQTETSGQWVYRVQVYNAVGTSSYSNSVTVRVR